MKRITNLLFIMIIISSCSKQNRSKNTFASRMKEFDKISKDSLGVLSTPTYYYLDTISVDTVKTKLIIRNVSKNKIEGFAIEPTCDCTVLKRKVTTTLLPTKDYDIPLELDLSETKGYFTKSIIVYGSFYPFYRNIVIEGYRK